MTDWTELKRLAEEATPGPWEIQASHYPESGDMIVTTDPNGWELLEIREDCPEHEANAAFIAAANPKTILALIAENEALRKRARIAEREAGNSLSMLKGLEKVARVVDANSDDVCGENNQLRAEVEALRELLRDSCEAIRHGEFSTGICCCGSSVDSHGFGDGHSPVDEGDYYVSGLIERIDSAIKASQ